MAESIAIPTTASPSPMTPRVAFELRLRYLETLLASRRDRPTATADDGITAKDRQSVLRRVASAHRALEDALDETEGSTDAVKRFISNYELNKPLLRPPIEQSLPPASVAPDLLSLDPAAKLAIVADAHDDVVDLERALRELETHSQSSRGAGAGGVLDSDRFANLDKLRPALDELDQRSKPLADRYDALEARMTAVLERYNDYIYRLSETFVEWNDIVSGAEAAVAKLEKDRAKGLDYE